MNGSDGAKAAEARGLLLQVKPFKFILCLVLFDRILSCTKSLSDALQCTQLDLARAADLVPATIEIVEEFRTECEWKKVLAYSARVVDLHKETTTSRPRSTPKRFNEGIMKPLAPEKRVKHLSSTWSTCTTMIDAFLSEPLY